MSELNNPLFESKKEFLERQKEEYKKALLSDVTEIKQQSQKVGKTLLIAGGALAGAWMLGSIFRGSGNKKDKASKGLNSATTPLLITTSNNTIHADELVAEDGSINYAQVVHAVPHTASTTYYAPQNEPSVFQEAAKTFMQSDMAKALSQQLTAFLLIYLTKKIEEHLNVSKNNDISTSKELEPKDINFSYHQENAV